MTADTPRWTQRPPGSNWGDFGADDQLGRLNLLNAACVRAAALEVREGRTFCLSLPLDLPGGSVLNARRKPPQLWATEKDGKPYLNFPMRKLDASSIDVLCDDQVILSLQYSTQWDSLAHVGAQFDAQGTGTPQFVYYNGWRAGEHVLGPVRYEVDSDQPSGCAHNAWGAKRLGIENFAVQGMQGRGVLVDLHRHFGRARQLVGHAELMQVLAEDGIRVAPGDFLLLRTGFAELIMEMAGQPDGERLHASCAVLDGTDAALLQWITDSGIVAICADNYAVEAYPARERPPGPKSLLPLHHHCLFKLGLPLGELWYLKDLAEALHATGRHRFMLTAPPLRLPGAVGSPVTPIATI